MKAEYDLRHNAKTPDFEIGQQVFLKDVWIPPQSNKILTKQPYNSHFCVIKLIIKFYKAGQAY